MWFTWFTEDTWSIDTIVVRKNLDPTDAHLSCFIIWCEDLKNGLKTKDITAMCFVAMLNPRPVADPETFERGGKTHEI